MLNERDKILNHRTVAILLCAGRGSRMRDNRTHKVCYEVAGIPAVIRQINNIKEVGIERIVVVIGNNADKVMSCLDGISGIVYAYQPEQKGTGNATIYGLKAVKSLDISDSVLVAMGDKIVSSDVYEAMIDKFTSNNDNRALFAIQPKEFNKSGGRIAIKHNKICGIIEKTDVELLRLGELKVQNEDEFKKALYKSDVDEKKKETILKKAKDVLKNKGRLPSKVNLAGNDFSASEIEGSGWVNTATYLFNVDAALEALETVKPNNAQNEIYLTDAINYIADKSGVDVVKVTERNKILTYSTMDELLQIQQFFSEPKKQPTFTKASKLLRINEDWEHKIRQKFIDIYGDDKEFVEDRRDAIIKLLKSFIEKYGDREVVICRAPARVNLMGRHIEHRGGSINVMSVNKETLVCAAKRDDDVVNISNLDSKFKDYSFSIMEAIKNVDTQNWVEFIENDAILKMVTDSKGEWVNYVKAAVLRLQLKNKDFLVSGMDMMFYGNIPVAAGLSSSSSIVVATAESVIALNDIDMQVKEFINLCGEGEWFVGSRGGSGDHAAMKCGRFGMITHLKFFPFEIDGSVQLPDDYRVIVANSYIEAKKSEGAKDLFNQRIACYEFGLMMIKKLFPQYAHKLNYLRDISTRNLSLTQSRIYEMLLALPEKMTSDEVHEQLSEYKDKIERIQKSHKIPEYYEVRSVVLYGIAECERANRSYELLKNGDYMTLGKLMNISHDGDRVWKDNKPFDYSASDSYLKSLISDLASEIPERVERAQIYNQPGGYACSTKVIDELVDYVNRQEGVLGSELSGAGLGGCILILVKKEKANDILDLLKKHYYEKNNLPMGAEIFKPVSGSSVFN